MIPSKIKYHDEYIQVHQIYNENYFLTPIQFRSESVLVLLVEYVSAEGPRMDALVAPIICPRLGGVTRVSFRPSSWRGPAEVSTEHVYVLCQTEPSSPKAHKGDPAEDPQS